MIKFENNDLNNILKIKYNNQKNGHMEKYLLTRSLVIPDSIFRIVIILLVAANLLINFPNNHNCETVSLLLAKKNSN